MPRSYSSEGSHTSASAGGGAGVVVAVDVRRASDIGGSEELGARDVGPVLTATGGTAERSWSRVPVSMIPMTSTATAAAAVPAASHGRYLVRCFASFVYSAGSP
ncbi:hypothetical protein D1871_11615 [Nakamurella silvestris]|nr:hypothetical protein D1871_11615 [Nakamurella silvestris]